MTPPPCKECGREIKKGKYQSNKQWLARVYCSQACNVKNLKREGARG